MRRAGADSSPSSEEVTPSSLEFESVEKDNCFCACHFLSAQLLRVSYFLNMDVVLNVAIFNAYQCMVCVAFES